MFSSKTNLALSYFKTKPGEKKILDIKNLIHI